MSTANNETESHGGAGSPEISVGQQLNPSASSLSYAHQVTESVISTFINPIDQQNNSAMNSSIIEELKSSRRRKGREKFPPRRGSRDVASREVGGPIEA
ncbi:hypothetical protein HYFRA_00004291 [Hymenoscyphus fraxineus]|uniref:Uncharacterized protein n=1 Tax=Hymenoscyphus fraxineus TaxID=746836 RepID=A0A9N9KMD0_9HELO|nr:hypothetical protein HYFRA_00004291 [Hymenoscyphus fraxineus]